MINIISKDINISTLIIFWQFILKGLDELSLVTNPILSLEMLFIRLIYLKDMPSYEAVLDTLNKNNLNPQYENIPGPDRPVPNLNEKKEINKISKEQIKSTTQMKPELASLNTKNLTQDTNLKNISSLEDLIKISSEKKRSRIKK